MGKRLFGVVSLVFVAYFILLVPIFDNAQGSLLEIARKVSEYGKYSNFTYPPLMIWLSAFCMKLFGVIDIVAKLPFAFALIGTLYFTFKTASALNESDRAGLIASMSVLTSIFMMFKFIGDFTGITSMFALSFMMYAVIEESLILFSLGAAFCTISSGFGGLPLGITIALSYCFANREFVFKKKQILWGALVFLLVVAPVFFVFRGHNKQLIMQMIDLSFNHKFYHPVYYFLVMIFMLMPWFMFIPTFASVYKEYAKGYERKTKMNWLTMTIVALFFVGFLFRLKLPEEVFAIVPFFAVFVGVSLDRFLKYDGKNVYGIISFFIGFVFTSYFLYYSIVNHQEFKNFVLYEKPFNIYYFIPLLVYLAFGWIFMIYQRRELSVWGLGIVSLITMFVLAKDYKVDISAKSMKNLAQFLQSRKVKYEDKLYTEIPQSDSLNFYLRKNVVYFKSASEIGNAQILDNEKVYFYTTSNIEARSDVKVKRIDSYNGFNLFSMEKVVVKPPEPAQSLLVDQSKIGVDGNDKENEKED